MGFGRIDSPLPHIAAACLYDGANSPPDLVGPGYNVASVQAVTTGVYLVTLSDPISPTDATAAVSCITAGLIATCYHYDDTHVLVEIVTPASGGSSALAAGEVSYDGMTATFVGAHPGFAAVVFNSTGDYTLELSSGVAFNASQLFVTVIPDPNGDGAAQKVGAPHVNDVDATHRNVQFWRSDTGAAGSIVHFYAELFSRTIDGGGGSATPTDDAWALMLVRRAIGAL